MWQRRARGGGGVDGGGTSGGRDKGEVEGGWASRAAAEMDRSCACTVRVDDGRVACVSVRRRTPSYRALLQGHSNGRGVDPPRRPCKVGAPPPWPEGPSWAPPGQASCRQGRAPPHGHAGGGGCACAAAAFTITGGFSRGPGRQGRESSPAALPGGGRPPPPHHLGAAGLVCKPIPQMQALMHRCGAWPRPPRRDPPTRCPVNLPTSRCWPPSL